MKPRRRLKIAMEASILAVDSGDSLSRTGIFRVAESLAQHLGGNSAVRLDLCLPDTWLGIDPQSIRRLRSVYKSNSISVPSLLTYRASVTRGAARCREIPDTVPIRELTLNDLRRFSKELRLYDRFGFRTTILVDKLARSLMLFEAKHKTRGCDVYLSTHYRQPTSEFLPSTTVHMFYDLIPHMFPHFLPNGYVRHFRRVLAGFRHSDFFICISEQVRKDLIENLDIDENRTFVALPAADPAIFHTRTSASDLTQVRERYGLGDQPYVLSVNTLEPRKNMPSLIRAFGSLVSEKAIGSTKLVLVGATGWLEPGSLERTIHEAGVADRVIITGYVPNEDLAPLYSGASAFVFPSHYEGFGLPVLEAMQCGTAVIASDRGALPEVVGDAGVLVDPDDINSIADAILTILDDSVLALRLRAAALERSKEFTWSQFSADVVYALQEAVRRSQNA